MNREAILSVLGLVGGLVVSCGDPSSDSPGGDGGSGAMHSGGGSTGGGTGGAHGGEVSDAGRGDAGRGDQGGSAGGVGGANLGGSSEGGSSDAGAGQRGSSEGGSSASGGIGGRSNTGGASHPGGTSRGGVGEGGADSEPGGAGAGSEAGGAAGGPSADRSRLVLAFPAAHSYSSATQVTIRGSAADPDGVKNVSIDGTNAQTTDGFANWRLTVQNPLGRNHFTVSVTDSLGNVSVGAQVEVVNQGPPLGNVRAMEFEPVTGSLIVSNYFAGQLLKVDTETGVTSIIAGPDRGSGVDFKGSIALALDGKRQRALVQNWASDVLLAIDLETGDCEEVSTGGAGAPSIGFTSALAVDAKNDRAFAVEKTQAVAIDLTTGARSLVASPERGTGEAVASFDDVVYDAAGGPAPRLLVSDPKSQAIVAIDVASGDRTLLSSAARGSGLWFTMPTHLELDATGRRLLVVDGSGNADSHTSYRVNRAALVAVDLSTGDRTTLSDPLAGNGFLPETPYALAFDGVRAYLANDWDGQIAAIDLASKERSLLVHSNAGTGYKPYYPQAVALFGAASNADELLMLEGLDSALVRVNLRTGARTLLSGATRGAGPTLGLANDVVVEDSQSGTPRRAFVLNAKLRGILSVNLESGDRSVISSPDVGEGPQLGPSEYPCAEGLALDSARNQLLVSTFAFGSSPAALTAVDLTSGNRSLVSSSARGTGPELVGLLDGVLVDPNPPSGVDRAFVVGNGSIMTVALATGDRGILSNGYAPIQGLGPPLPYANDAVINPLNQTLLVAGGLYSYLAAVRLDNGNRGTASGRDTLNHSLVGLGPELSRLSGVAFDSVRNVAYVSDYLQGALLAVDMTNGDRVIIAR